MKRRMVAVGVIILLLLGVNVSGGFVKESKEISSVGFDGNILYVGGSGPNNYTTIQDAVDDANDDDTVYVYNDSSPYYENVILYKSIDLIGENRETTIIDGGGSGDVIHIDEDAHGITICGFTIQNGGDNNDNAGVQVLSSLNSIEHNIIRYNGYYGVHCLNDGWWDGCNSVADNIIMYNKWGIYFHEQLDSTISGNYISNNTHGICLGLYYLPTGYNNGHISGDYLNNVYNNVITNNSEIGIIIIGYWYTSISIYDNLIKENDYGITLQAVINSECTSNYIYDNEIVGNLIGIRLIAEPLGSIFECFIFKNRIYENEIGICMDTVRKGDISNNIICNNSISDSLDGIVCKGNDVSGNDIFSNNISNNDELGIWFNLSHGNQIHENNFIDNNVHGKFSYDLTIVSFLYFIIFKDASEKENKWLYNYWDDNDGNQSQIINGIIQCERLGEIVRRFGFSGDFFYKTWSENDTNPASEPYDIEV